MGASLQLTATVKDTGNRVLTGELVTWASSNPALATISSDGFVVGRYAGSVTVTATARGVAGSAPVTITPPAGPSVVETISVLDSTQAAFLRFAEQTDGDPARALGLAAERAAADPRVASAELIDSSYLQLQLKSGTITVYRYDETGADGRSLFRGGGRDDSFVESRLSRFGNVAQVIPNKKVLICAAAYAQFYTDAEMQKVVDRFVNSGLGFQVTLLKNAACNYRAVSTFANYGLVIIDTHGVPNGFMTGETIPYGYAADASEAMTKAFIDSQIAPGTYDKLASGDLALFRTITIPVAQQGLQWWKGLAVSLDELWVTSQFVRSLPMMPNTIVFGNMCYSGYVSRPGFNPPTGGIQPAFMSTGLIAYYGYALLDGSSRKVSNSFALEMEDSLTHAFVDDGDSTGIAHLNDNLGEFEDPASRPAHDLWLRQFGALDFSYFRVTIAPDTALGEFGTPVGFVADNFGTAPVHALYEWDFGDGTAPVRIANSLGVTHTYQAAAGMNPGPPSVFDVTLTLYNNADPAHPRKLATATAAARMAGQTWRLSEFTLESVSGTSLAAFNGFTIQGVYQPIRSRLDSIVAHPEFTVFTLLPSDAPYPMDTLPRFPLGASALFFRTPAPAVVTPSPSTFVLLAAHTLNGWDTFFPPITTDFPATLTQTGTLNSGTVSGIVPYFIEFPTFPDGIHHALSWGRLDAQLTGGIITGHFTVTTREWGPHGNHTLMGERVEVYRFLGTRY